MSIILDQTFDTPLDTNIWGCEYQCPSISASIARFKLSKGNLNTNQTWSKLVYKPQKQNLSYGIYTMVFRFNRRPLETEIWSGLALWDNSQSDQNANEVNFGIDTACQQRCDDTTLILESYKDGKNSEVICKTGTNLFDSSNPIFHTGTLIYLPNKIELQIDNRSVGSNTDPKTIPTSKMTFIPGARVVTGQLNSEFYMDVSRFTITDTTPISGCPKL